MQHSAVSLQDKYTLDFGRVYITGIQALVRLSMMQRRRDPAAEHLRLGGLLCRLIGLRDPTEVRSPSMSRTVMHHGSFKPERIADERHL